MMKKKIKINRLLFVVAAFVLSLFCVFEGAFSTVRAETVYASTSENTPQESVMEDLYKDESFDEADFPKDETDYSLEVFQIAESVDDKLYLYVYQPSDEAKEMEATSVNLCTTSKDDIDPTKYPLTLVSTYGVFDKYLVDDLTVSSASVRYYKIVSICRAYDSEIDGLVGGSLPPGWIEEVALEVAQMWTVTTTQDGVIYVRENIDVIKIETQVVGYIRYDDGLFPDFGTIRRECDSWLVAFSTDKQIDELYSAKVSYATQGTGLEIILGVPIKTKGDKTYHEVTVKYSESASNDGDGLFGKKYTWDRIEKTSEFLQKNAGDVSYTSGTLSDLENTQWILRFAETEISRDIKLYGGSFNGEKVSDVSVLMMEFRTGAKTYKLGVVGNSQSGGLLGEADDILDDVRDNLKDFFNDVFEKDFFNDVLELDEVFLSFKKFAKIVLLVGIVLLAVLGLFILVMVVSGIGLFGRMFVAGFKCITFPFRAIGKLFKKKNKK